MKKLLLTSLSLALLAACSQIQPFQQSQQPNSQVQSASFSRPGSHSVITIQLRSEQELIDLSTRGLDLFGLDPQKRFVKARVNASELNALQQLQTRFINTVERAMDTRGGLPSGYMTYAQMVPQLQALAQKHPQLVKLWDAGDTWLKTQGKAPHEIWALSLTNQKVPGKKPTMLLIGGVHARELAPVEILMKLMHLLTSEYGKDPQITKIMDTRELVFMPMVNVDGRVEVERGDSWKRKNMNTTRGDGVDLNRNYDNHWNYEGLDVPSSWKNGLSNPNGQIYSGSGPASEPETQAVQQMFHMKKPKIAIDMHAYGEMMLWPLGYLKTDIADTPKFRAIYNNTVQKLGFRGGTSAQILYPTTATTRDYAYGKHGAASMTLEIGQSFRPSYSEVEQIWKELQPNLLKMAEMSGEI